MTYTVTLWNPEYEQGDIVEGVADWGCEEGIVFLWADTKKKIPLAIWAIPDGGIVEFEDGEEIVEFTMEPGVMSGLTRVK